MEDRGNSLWLDGNEGAMFPSGIPVSLDFLVVYEVFDGDCEEASKRVRTIQTESDAATRMQVLSLQKRHLLH